MDGQIRPKVPTEAKPRVREVAAPWGGVRWVCYGGGIGAYGCDMDEAFKNWHAGRSAQEATRKAWAARWAAA